LAQTLNSVDRWLGQHMGLILGLIVLAGFALRATRAAALYWNADESMIMFAPLQHGLINVYHAMLIHPHGPIPNFLLYYLTFFGTSEFLMRLPSVVAGALLPYVVYLWVSLLYNRTAGLIAALILAFAPSMTMLSAELRFYSLQMLFMACSLYAIERAFQETSKKWLWLFGICASIAFLSEYSSIWYIAGIAAYGSIRLLVNDKSRTLLTTWSAILVGFGALLLVVYVVHLKPLQGTEGEAFAKDVWLRASYYHPDSQNVGTFLVYSTAHLFPYVFASVNVGLFMGLVFLGGLALMFGGGTRKESRLVGLSLCLPLATTAAAGLVSLYPYGGSRHDAFLAVFIAAGVSIAIAWATRSRPSIVLAAAFFLVPIWLKAAKRDPLDDQYQVSKREQMVSALDYLATRNPKPNVLVADQIGSTTASVYICHGELKERRRLSGNLTSYQCGGKYRLLTIESWAAPASSYPQALEEARRLLPEVLSGEAWRFMISTTRDADYTTVSNDSAVFGKIEIERLP
jgi:4-amino-4-deoxy-L-arabinose transferase-like glycosyltransferase